MFSQNWGKIPEQEFDYIITDLHYPSEKNVRVEDSPGS